MGRHRLFPHNWERFVRTGLEILSGSKGLKVADR